MGRSRDHVIRGPRLARDDGTDRSRRPRRGGPSRLRDLRDPPPARRRVLLPASRRPRHPRGLRRTQPEIRPVGDAHGRRRAGRPGPALPGRAGPAVGAGGRGAGLQPDPRGSGRAPPGRPGNGGHPVVHTPPGPRHAAAASPSRPSGCASSVPARRCALERRPTWRSSVGSDPGAQVRPCRGLAGRTTATERIPIAIASWMLSDARDRSRPAGPASGVLLPGMRGRGLPRPRDASRGRGLSTARGRPRRQPGALLR